MLLVQAGHCRYRPRRGASQQWIGCVARGPGSVMVTILYQIDPDLSTATCELRIAR